MRAPRRQDQAPAPALPLEPEELRLIELLAAADAERDYRAAMKPGESGEDGALRPL